MHLCKNGGIFGEVGTSKLYWVGVEVCWEWLVLGVSGLGINTVPKMNRSP